MTHIVLDVIYLSSILFMKKRSMENNCKNRVTIQITKCKNSLCKIIQELEFVRIFNFAILVIQQ